MGKFAGLGSVRSRVVGEDVEGVESSSGLGLAGHCLNGDCVGVGLVVQQCIFKGSDDRGELAAGHCILILGVESGKLSE